MLQPKIKQALDAATQVAFKSCAPFKKGSTEIDGTLVDESNFINITMPIYNLIEYSDNYSDTSGALWCFKRDEIDVPIVTLSAEDNVKLSKLLGEGFKRYIYWNKYKVIDNIIVHIAAQNEEK